MGFANDHYSRSEMFFLTIIVVMVSLLFFAVPSAKAAAKQASNAIWITDVTIISPEKLDHVEKGSVLIENGRITRVDRGQNAKKPAGAVVISGKDQYLIPGLIDSHVHLASVPGMKFDEDQAQRQMVREQGRHRVRSSGRCPLDERRVPPAGPSPAGLRQGPVGR